MRRRSAFSVRDIFEELRFNYDVTSTVSQAELVQFAELSGCSDLLQEAWLTTEEYQRRLENAGGQYPVEEMRKTFGDWVGRVRIKGVNVTGGGLRPRLEIIRGVTAAPHDRTPSRRPRTRGSKTRR